MILVFDRYLTSYFYLAPDDAFFSHVCEWEIETNPSRNLFVTVYANSCFNNFLLYRNRSDTYQGKH